MCSYERVLLSLSGGVDSAMTAALLHRAVPEQLVCVFVDNGLLRLGEADQVMKVFADRMGMQVEHVNAGERFFAALEGAANGEYLPYLCDRGELPRSDRHSFITADIAAVICTVQYERLRLAAQPWNRIPPSSTHSRFFEP